MPSFKALTERSLSLQKQLQPSIKITQNTNTWNLSHVTIKCHFHCSYRKIQCIQEQSSHTFAKCLSSSTTTTMVDFSILKQQKAILLSASAENFPSDYWRDNLDKFGVCLLLDYIFFSKQWNQYIQYQIWNWKCKSVNVLGSIVTQNKKKNLCKRLKSSLRSNYLSFIASQKTLRSWKRMSKQGRQQILNHKCFAPLSVLNHFLCILVEDSIILSLSSVAHRSPQLL